MIIGFVEIFVLVVLKTIQLLTIYKLALFYLKKQISVSKGEDEETKYKKYSKPSFCVYLSIMKNIRKIIKKQLFKLYENDSFGTAIKSGEYSTEKMENFLFKIVDLVQWGNNNYGDGPHITIPSYWPSSSVSYTPESIISDWEKAKQYYSDPDTKWYVWTVKVGGNLNKPKYIASQRIDLEDILRIVSKYPESFNYITIGVGNEMTKKSGKDIKGN